MAGHAKAKRRNAKLVQADDTVKMCRRSFSGMEFLGHNILTHRKIIASTDDGPCEIVMVPKPCDYAMGMLDPFRCDLHGHILLMIHDANHAAPLEQKETR